MNRVAIDVDEVLVNFLFPMANHNYKLHKLRSKPKYNYVYREIFEIDEPSSKKMVQEFYQSKAFMELKPIPGSQKAMYKLRRGANKMYIVTGRQDSVREETETRIETYFPNIFDDVILTNSYTPHEVKKSDICRALNIGLIIDDNKGICDQCIEAGSDAINFIGGDIYPWCEENEISLKRWDELKL